MRLWHKNTLVLETNKDGQLTVFHKELIPYSIQKDDISFEDLAFNWIPARAIPIGRSNAKMILNSARIPQNSMTICQICHGLSLLDCYWISENDESLDWNHISLYQNEPDLLMAETALTGKSNQRKKGPLHTPETTTHGMAAKCWMKENDTYYMYKIGKKELAASKILDALNINHVTYEEVTVEESLRLTTRDRRDKILNENEKIVKSKCITSEEVSILPFEDFAMYCASHHLDEIKEAVKINPIKYYEMQIADYILNNDDRHAGNWGFLLDADRNKVIDYHPLMDHDHAFSLEENIHSQTMEHATLEEAAICALDYVNIPFSNLFEMEKPEELTDIEWKAVTWRTEHIIKKQKEGM